MAEQERAIIASTEVQWTMEPVLLVQQELRLPSPYEMRPYTPEDAQRIYGALEKPNWAPWLAAPADTLARRTEVFPEGQLALWDAQGQPVASLSLNRFQWDGDPQSLKTWDQLAGEYADYSDTYDPNGNSVGMMSINVRPDSQGGGLTRAIIEGVRTRMPEIGVTNIMGSFRPSQLGAYLLDMEHVDKLEYERLFQDYIFLREIKAGKEVAKDKWLRALERNGMRILRVDQDAMVVTANIAQFEQYRLDYHPDQWKETVNGGKHVFWRCGETGIWEISDDGNMARYSEGNVWGILDQTP